MRGERLLAPAAGHIGLASGAAARALGLAAAGGGLQNANALDGAARIAAPRCDSGGSHRAAIGAATSATAPAIRPAGAQRLVSRCQ